MFTENIQRKGPCEDVLSQNCSLAILGKLCLVQEGRRGRGRVASSQFIVDVHRSHEGRPPFFAVSCWYLKLFVEAVLIVSHLYIIYFTSSCCRPTALLFMQYRARLVFPLGNMIPVISCSFSQLGSCGTLRPTPTDSEVASPLSFCCRRFILIPILCI